MEKKNQNILTLFLLMKYLTLCEIFNRIQYWLRLIRLLQTSTC
jgi:hypothetical protein